MDHVVFALGRRREITGFVQALQAGAWDHLDAQLKTHRLPRRQDWRVALWKAAVPTTWRPHDLELRGCAWLRAHGMRLRSFSRQAVMEHVMEQAHENVLQPLLDSFGPRPGFALDVLLPRAIRRPDDKGLAWLHAHQVDLDPLKATDHPPALQWVLTTRVIQPATVRVVKGLLDRGVRVRAPEGVRPLAVLLTVAERHDLSVQANFECVQRLWTMLDAAGDDPTAPEVKSALARVPCLAQWWTGCQLAAQRQARTPAHPLTLRSRCRA